jgi:hypothetical protein
MATPIPALRHAARLALVAVTAGAAGIIWMCAAPCGHDYYARTHAAPTLDGQPLQAEAYANPAR